MDKATLYVLKALGFEDAPFMQRRIEELLARLPAKTVNQIEEALAPTPEPDPNQLDIFSDQLHHKGGQ